MKLYNRTKKILSIPIANHNSQLNIFKTKKLNLFRSNNLNNDKLTFTTRIYSSKKKEKEKENKITSFSKSREKNSIESIESQCPGGKSCFYFEKYCKIKEEYQKLLYDNKNIKEINKYFKIVLKQKEMKYIKLKEENIHLKEILQKQEKKCLTNNKNIKNDSFNSSPTSSRKNLISNEKNKNEFEIDVSSLIFKKNQNHQNTNILSQSNNKFHLRKRTKSLIFTLNTFKLNEPEKNKKLNLVKKKNSCNTNKESALNHYNKIMSLNNRRHYHKSTIDFSFLVTPKDFLIKKIKNPLLEELFKYSQDEENFIDKINSSSYDKIFEICDLIITTIKDYKELIKLIIRIQDFLKASESIIESILTNDFYNIITNNVCSILNCEKTLVFIYDKISDMLVLYKSESLEKNNIKIPKNKGIVGSVYLTGDKLKIENVNLDKRFNNEIDKITNFKTNNMLCYPLKDKNEKIFGVIQALNKIKNDFDKDDLELMDILSKQVSFILKSKLNLGESNVILSKMKLLINFSNETLYINNIRELTKKSESLFYNLYSFSKSKLYFYDYENKELIHLNINKDDNRFKPLGILNLVLKKNEMHVCTSIKECKYFNDLVDLNDGNSLITFPIFSEGILIAILQFIYNGKIKKFQDSLDDNELIIIQLFSEIFSNFINFITNKNPKNILNLLNK